MNHKPIYRALAALAVTAVLGGCASSSPFTGEESADLADSSGAIPVEFQECRDRGLTIQASAESTRSEAMYLRAGQVMNSCLDVLTEWDPVPTSERMRLGAMAVLAQIKGGDTDAARLTLADLEAQNPGRDLYLADNTSVIDSLHLLLGEVPSDVSTGGILNVSAPLSAEMKRIDYWQAN